MAAEIPDLVTIDLQGADLPPLDRWLTSETPEGRPARLIAVRDRTVRRVYMVGRASLGAPLPWVAAVQAWVGGPWLYLQAHHFASEEEAWTACCKDARPGQKSAQY